MQTTIPPGALESAVRTAIDEDVGAGDLTTQSTIPEDLTARAVMVSRENCIIAGLPVARRVFECLDPKVRFESSRKDGERAKPGEILCTVTGSARALLTGERTALNFVQRLSGIATLTAEFVAACGGKVAILHTRKTTPGLRDLEIYAVEVGGGKRHRAGLFDQILIKENHFALSGLTIRETIQKARREAGPDVVVGAEARNRTEAWAAIDAGAHYVLLDNYTPDMLATEVPILREMMQKKGRRVLLEASGGIGRENIRRFAATGVDRISIGALTHSARAIDLALDVEALSVS